MKELETEKILYEINTGKGLRAETFAEVSEVLLSYFEEGKLSADDAYAYLLIVCRDPERRGRKIVERFLVGPDTLLACLALETLSRGWKLTEDYLEKIGNFVVGVSWDSDEDLRMLSIALLGDFLSERHIATKSSVSATEKESLSLLLSIFEDKEADSWVKKGAYNAMLVALGKEPLSVTKPLVVSVDVDVGTLSRVQELLQFSSSTVSSITASKSSASAVRPAIR